MKKIKVWIPRLSLLQTLSLLQRLSFLLVLTAMVLPTLVFGDPPPQGPAQPAPPPPPPPDLIGTIIRILLSLIGL